jgi:uncharacterized protein
MSFLHGVETITAVIGARSITVVKSAVILLVGLAPIGPAQTLTLVNSDADAAQFGSKLTGFTIPQALDAIFKQGAGTVIVCNVYATATHDVTVTNEAQTITSRKVATTYHPTNAVVVKDVTNTTTYVKDTDYTIDDFGNIIVLATTLTDTTVLHLTYKHIDTTTVTSAHINGTLTSGVRTGIKLFEECYSTFGFKGKILIAPGYSSVAAVATNMISFAEANRAFCLLDAPLGTSLSVAVAGRGPSGSINFYTSSKRAILLFPEVKDYGITGALQNSVYSPYFAGVMANTDNTEGYHVSPSNHEIKGIGGTELVITAGINDPAAETNTLNAAGITTIFNAFGTGFRTWGNRSAAYPVYTTIDTFVSVLRTSDIIAESIELASLPYIDKPITQALIDQIIDDVNSFLRLLKGRGAIIEGVCTFDKTKNPDVNMAAGNLVFDYNFLPPPPLERLTFNAFININFLSKLV